MSASRASILGRFKRDLDGLCNEIAEGENAFTLLDVTFDDWHCLADVVVSMRGPPDSPFEDGTFMLKLQYPSDWPDKPPRVMFLTRMFHPNIMLGGTIDNVVQKDGWSPGITLFHLLLHMRLHLSDTSLTCHGHVGREAELDTAVRSEYVDRCLRGGLKLARGAGQYALVVNSEAGAAWLKGAAYADSLTRAHVARHATREMLPLPTPAAEALQQVRRGQRSPFGRVSCPAATV